MRKAAARRSTPPLSGHTVVRILISSYFMALGIGLIPGTDPAVLLSSFMPWLPARIITGALIVTLAVMILVGVHRRAAALLLAIVIFWSSYMAILALPGAEDIGGFWRDLALIGALILTYANGDDLGQNDAVVVFRHLPRQNAANLSGPAPTSAMSAPTPNSRETRKRQTAKDQRPYREDFDIVRAS